MSDQISESDRARACRLDDLALDLMIATVRAQAQVLRAHGRGEMAAELHDRLVMLAEVRDERRRLYAAAEDAMYPGVDLGEVDDDA